MELSEKRQNIIDSANKEFQENHIWAEAEPYFELDIVIQVDVDGDWRHDHWATKQIMEKYNCSQIGEKMVEDSESDSYHSIHYFVIKS